LAQLRLRRNDGALENGKKNLQLSTLERVCAGLNILMSEIIRDAEAL